MLVVGITGAGKTTFARSLAEYLGLPFHEMDALAFGPNWTTPPDFVNVVDEITGGSRWVIDSMGYPQVTDVMWARADTIVWLDFSRRITFGRTLRRSLGRTIRRERIFNGNRESWRGWFARDHPAWWSWTGHGPRRTLIETRLAEARNRHLVVHRHRTPAAAQAWLDSFRVTN